MAHNAISQLTRKIFDIFIADMDSVKPENPANLKHSNMVLQFHTEPHVAASDASISAVFPNWQQYCEKNKLTLRAEAEGLLLNSEAIAELLAKCEPDYIALKQPQVLTNERYTLQFDRRLLTEYVLRNVLEHGERYGQPKKLEGDAGTLYLKVSLGNMDDLRVYRAQLLHGILRRLLDYSVWQVVPSDETKELTVRMTVLASHLVNHPQFKRKTPSEVRVLTGSILESPCKTPTMLSTTEYLALRSNDMLLIAMHRHGVRDYAKCPGHEQLIQRLGSAAVTVDLFEVRHSVSATIVRNGLGCSKGAAYVLYNSARLETLLRKFNDLVEEGVYTPLPPIETIDFTLLNDEVEWQLIYGHLFAFPNVMETALQKLFDGHIGVHQIVRYTINLAKLFSRFYRSKQVLVQHRPQLMPMIHARIYLIMGVRQVLNASLKVLGIDPVHQM